MRMLILGYVDLRVGRCQLDSPCACSLIHVDSVLVRQGNSTSVVVDVHACSLQVFVGEHNRGCIGRIQSAGAARIATYNKVISATLFRLQRNSEVGKMSHHRCIADNAM